MKSLSSIVRRLSPLAVVLASGGCWEEIRYDRTELAATAPAADAGAGDQPAGEADPGAQPAEESSQSGPATPGSVPDDIGPDAIPVLPPEVQPGNPSNHESQPTDAAANAVDAGSAAEPEPIAADDAVTPQPEDDDQSPAEANAATPDGELQRPSTPADDPTDASPADAVGDPADVEMPAADQTAAADAATSEETATDDGEAATDPTAFELFGDSVPEEGAEPPDGPEQPIVGGEENASDDLQTAQRRLNAWIAASAWSLSAAIHAKGLEASRYQSFVEESQRACRALAIEPPALPTAVSGQSLENAAIAALDTGAGRELAATLAERVDDQAASAARLAIRSHLLLLTYTPLGTDAPAEAKALRDAGVRSGLPAEAWEPLVELLDERAEFVAVRRAVFQLHERAAAFLAGQAAQSGR